MIVKTGPGRPEIRAYRRALFEVSPSEALARLTANDRRLLVSRLFPGRAYSRRIALQAVRRRLADLRGLESMLAAFEAAEGRPATTLPAVEDPEAAP